VSTYLLYYRKSPGIENCLPIALHTSNTMALCMYLRVAHHEFNLDALHISIPSRGRVDPGWLLEIAYKGDFMLSFELARCRSLATCRLGSWGWLLEGVTVWDVEGVKG
jgi:hypothetical protein